MTLAAPVFRTSEAQEIRLRAQLTGFEEVPPLLTAGQGEFTATINRSRTSMTFTLTYSGLSTDATAAHIHFGQRRVNGGVMIFFCQNPPAAGRQPCPLRSGTVQGTVTAADVVGPLTQGINPGNFENVIHAIQSGHTYANVHSTRWPAGEIRGQVRTSGPNR
jgi:hypothetical protein